jgi:hypothetical protein
VPLAGAVKLSMERGVLLETFHLLSSPANADRLLVALERSNAQETLGQSVESLRKEFELGKKTS